MTGMRYETLQCSCLQKYNILYKKKHFSCLVCTRYIAIVNPGISIVASINTTNVKVCMFRGLSHDIIKVGNWYILRTYAIEKLR